MALDEANHRLLIGCRRPAKVLVYGTSSGKEVSSLDIVGYIDVFQAAAGRFSRAARVTTAPRARTSLFVPSTSQLHLAVPHRGSHRAEIRVYQGSLIRRDHRGQS